MYDFFDYHTDLEPFIEGRRFSNYRIGDLFMSP